MTPQIKNQRRCSSFSTSRHDVHGTLYAVCFILLYSFPMLLTSLTGRAQRTVSLADLSLVDELIHGANALVRVIWDPLIRFP